MLTRPQVQRYAAESGLRDLMIAEKEVILTYLIQLLAAHGLLDKLAFKGGTCLRKMFIGTGGRFSTDLDFTGLEEHDHEDVILDMMAAFQDPYHGITFSIPDDSYYETQDGLSWGVNPVYFHGWNSGEDSEVRLQISRRETPTLPTEQHKQCEQSYFRHLPFAPVSITCLALPEIIAKKIRACYQRNKARDIYDLAIFATHPLDQALIRCLVILKLWQACDTFEPERLMHKFRDGTVFDWDDLGQLVRKTHTIDPAQVTADCIHGLAFLADMTPDEKVLASDRYQREHALWERLRNDLPAA